MTKISEALEYTRTLVNQRTDEDGYYGAQCVDLPMHLTQKYFGMRTWGNAIDYTGNAQPQGTVRLYNIDEAQPMDYFVLNGAGGYGHIGVIIEVDGDYMLTLEQNLAGDLDNGSPAVFREWSKASMRNAFECLIRLPFENDNGESGSQTPQADTPWELIPENGKFTLTVNSINVRTAPSLTAEVVAVYEKGETVVYDYKVVNQDGYNWISYIRNGNGQRAYMACRENKDGVPQELWGTIE